MQHSNVEQTSSTTNVIPFINIFLFFSASYHFNFLSSCLSIIKFYEKFSFKYKKVLISFRNCLGNSNPNCFCISTANSTLVIFYLYQQSLIFKSLTFFKRYCSRDRILAVTLYYELCHCKIVAFYNFFYLNIK